MVFSPPVAVDLSDEMLVQQVVTSRHPRSVTSSVSRCLILSHDFDGSWNSHHLDFTSKLTAKKGSGENISRPEIFFWARDAAIPKKQLCAVCEVFFSSISVQIPADDRSAGADACYRLEVITSSSNLDLRWSRLRSNMALVEGASWPLVVWPIGGTSEAKSFHCN